MYTRSDVRRYVVAAVRAVGLTEADSEPFRLVQLGGRQQKQHSPVESGIGPPTAQVAREHLPIDVTF
jgi:hypothetical protein